MIIIEPGAKTLLIEDAVKSFPDECCGFMFGVEEEEENRLIKEILVVNNAKEGDKQGASKFRRWIISKQNNMRLIIIYHCWGSIIRIQNIRRSHPKPTGCRHNLFFLT